MRAASIVLATLALAGTSALAQSPETHTHEVPDSSSSTGTGTEIHTRHRHYDQWYNDPHWFKRGSGEAWKRVHEMLDAPAREPEPTMGGGGGVRGLMFERSSAWTGSWVRNDCVETGGAVGTACGLSASFGTFTLRLHEYGPATTGTLCLGSFEVSLRGTREPNGTLRLAGKGEQQKALVRIDSLEVSNPGAEVMTGSFTATVTPSDHDAGAIKMRAALAPITRSSPK